MTEDRVSRFSTLVVRLCALWVAAGAAFKLFAGSPNDLPPLVQSFFLGKDTTFRVAISIELVFLSTALLRPKWAWPWMAALYGAFLIVLGELVLSTASKMDVSLLKAAFSNEVSCGCFGSKVKIPPGVMMSIDGVLLLLLLLSRPWKVRMGELGPAWLPTGCAALAVVAPWLVRSGIEQAQVIQNPEGEAQVVGARFVEIPLARWKDLFVYDVDFLRAFVPELDTLPSDGTYVFFRATCDHCKAHIQELAEKDDGSRPFVFIEIPEKGIGEEQRIVRIFPQGGHVTHLRLPEGTEYLLTTPADFEVEGGVITAVREGIGLR